MIRPEIWCWQRTGRKRQQSALVEQPLDVLTLVLGFVGGLLVGWVLCWK